MKTYEKIITLLAALALFVCLSLTGQAIFRTACRSMPQVIQAMDGHFKDAYRPRFAKSACASHSNARFTSLSGALLRRDEAAPATDPPKSRQGLPRPAPAAARQIASYILYLLLYLRTFC